MLTSGLTSSNTDEWATPQDLFDALDATFHFTLDPCATPENAKCAKFYTKEQDGLKQDWGGEVIWCNPPYGREIGKWVKKCAEHRGVAVMLIPARTDTRWWHSYIEKDAFPCYTSTDFVTGTNVKGPAVFDMELAFIAGLNWHSLSAIKQVSDNLNLEQYERSTK